jgi:hypothetical protein
MTTFNNDDDVIDNDGGKTNAIETHLAILVKEDVYISDGSVKLHLLQDRGKNNREDEDDNNNEDKEGENNDNNG